MTAEGKDKSRMSLEEEREAGQGHSGEEGGAVGRLGKVWLQGRSVGLQDKGGQKSLSRRTAGRCRRGSAEPDTEDGDMQGPS